MDLIDIPTKNEMDRIRMLNLTNIENVWTSGNDLGLEGKYVWMNTGEEFTYENFDVYNPDNYLNKEHCIDLRCAFNYQWDDTPCLRELVFICRQKKETCRPEMYRF